jgi:hypothetical protein
MRGSAVRRGHSYLKGGKFWLLISWLRVHLKGKIRNIAKPSSSYHEVRWEVFGQGVGKSKFLRVEPDHLSMTHDELCNNCWPRGSMRGKITPAVQALQQAQVGFQLLEYDYDPSADAIGLQAAQALGRDPSTVFKTLVIALDSGELVCAIVPSDRQLNLKAIAAGAGAKKASWPIRGRRSAPPGMSWAESVLWDNASVCAPLSMLRALRSTKLS